MKKKNKQGLVSGSESPKRNFSFVRVKSPQQSYVSPNIARSFLVLSYSVPKIILVPNPESHDCIHQLISWQRVTQSTRILNEGMV